MTTPADYLDARLNELRHQFAANVEEIRVRTAQTPLLKAKIEELEMARKSIVGDDSEEDGEDGSRDANSRLTGHNGHQFHGATEAIFAFLREFGSEGERPKLIVAGVEGSFKTASINPQRSVYSTIHNLVKGGRLERTPAGRIRIPKSDT